MKLFSKVGKPHPDCQPSMWDERSDEDGWTIYVACSRLEKPFRMQYVGFERSTCWAKTEENLVKHRAEGIWGW